MKTTKSTRSIKKNEFKIGKVKGYLRGQVWYLHYYENGNRYRPRIGKDLQLAKQTAAELNSQLEYGLSNPLVFQPIGFEALIDRWFNYHENIARSSIATIKRYRNAIDHVLRFLDRRRIPKQVSQFSVAHAEDLVCYLRTVDLNSRFQNLTSKRPMRDKGIKFILQTCRSLFNYALKHHHLPPYSSNPISQLNIERIPVDDAKPIKLLTPKEECHFFRSCDSWQFVLFATLSLTGMRPGEILHLTLPDDLDLNKGCLFIRNKQRLGWQVKSRNERTIPLVAPLVVLLKRYLNGRRSGLVFRKRNYQNTADLFEHFKTDKIVQEIDRRFELRMQDENTMNQSSRFLHSEITKQIWNQAGRISNPIVWNDFTKLCQKIGRSDCTAPKLFRHMFATTLQEGNVDPIIRCELMGHSIGNGKSNGAFAMTSLYTHTNWETKVQQLKNALTPKIKCIFQN